MLALDDDVYGRRICVGLSSCKGGYDATVVPGIYGLGQVLGINHFNYHTVLYCAAYILHSVAEKRGRGAPNDFAVVVKKREIEAVASVITRGNCLHGFECVVALAYIIRDANVGAFFLKWLQ